MRALFAPLLVFAAASCASYEGTARTAFVHAASCPADRVTIAHPPPPTPPPDIAADPGRLALWKDDTAKRIEHQFVATGCGQEQRYSCDTRSASDGQATATWIECTPDVHLR